MSGRAFCHSASFAQLSYQSLGTVRVFYPQPHMNLYVIPVKLHHAQLSATGTRFLPRRPSMLTNRTRGFAQRRLLRLGLVAGGRVYKCEHMKSNRHHHHQHTTSLHSTAHSTTTHCSTCPLPRRLRFSSPSASATSRSPSGLCCHP